MTTDKRNATVDGLVARREEIIAELAIMSPRKDGTPYHVDRVNMLVTIAGQLRSLGAL